MQPKIKICGITTSGDARLAESCGADFIGLVCEIACSPRCISRAAAAALTGQARLPAVLLTDKPALEVVEIALQTRPFGLQLIGQYTPGELELIKKKTGCSIWLPVQIPECASGSILSYLNIVNRCVCDIVILDTLISGMKGGTGRTCDWKLAEKITAASRMPIFLAGGITPENAARACSCVRPAGIDVSSGVEKSPGVKDPSKVKSLIQKIHSQQL